MESQARAVSPAATALLMQVTDELLCLTFKRQSVDASCRQGGDLLKVLRRYIEAPRNRRDRKSM